MKKLLSLIVAAATLGASILTVSTPAQAKPASSKNIKKYAADSKADKARTQAKFDAQRAARNAKKK